MSAKKKKGDIVSILDSMQKLSHGPQLRERDLLLLKTKCSRTKATAVLKVIAQDCWKTISVAVERLNTSASKLMRQLCYTTSCYYASILRLTPKDSWDGSYLPHSPTLSSATAELLFNAIDKHFQDSATILYDNLVGLGTDGADVMLGARNSVMSQLRCKQPALVALHCHCRIGALIANEACKALPGELEDLTIYDAISRRAQGGCDS